MLVLLDLEWIELGEKFLTQISAIRTDKNWNAESRLEIFVKPSISCLKRSDHLAFGGRDTRLFQNGVSEEECIRDFADWLCADDVIITWAQSNKEHFTELWKRYIDAALPRTESVAGRMRVIARERGLCAANIYSILAGLGETPPQPEHLASNDTEVMRRVFSLLDLTIEKIVSVKLPPQPEKKIIPQRMRNQKYVEKSPYNFIYLRNSEVFHLRSCKACLCAKDQNDILGSIYYETAAKRRRPCKLCKPTPPKLEAPISDGDLAFKEKKASEKLNKYTREVINAKMLTGEVISIRRGHIVGWCHHKMHPGAVNKSILEAHNCIGKNCPYLERNCQSSFWPNYEANQKEIEERKEKLRKERLQKTLEQQELNALTNNWSAYLADMDSDMQIVRIEKESPNTYRIFYVSDNGFADGNRFPEFLDTLKYLHPHYRIRLRHIRAMDRHFVTRSEYKMIKRK